MRPWGVKRLFRFPLRSRAMVRAEIHDEVEFHLEMRTRELTAGGLSEATARAQAQREFGDRSASLRVLSRIDERAEQRRRFGLFWTEILQDARLGVRLLRRSPGFAAVAILTLALGIGANTAIYSVLEAALLRPLPYPEAERLVQVSETLENGSTNSVSGGAFLDWRRHQSRFTALTLLSRVSYNLRGNSVTERVSGLEASHEFLQVLGIQPLFGRGFGPEDDRPGGHNDVVLLTEEMWRSRFGGDLGIVGRTIVLDEIPRTVIGVLPSGAWMFRDDQFVVPAVLLPETPRAQRSPHWAVVFGRLAPGVTILDADADLKAIKQRLEPEYPAFKRRWSVTAQPAIDVIAGVTRTPLVILAAAVSLVLLIACANVANLLLARGYQREQELAVRAALGAGARRLVRQVLTENATLALLGGVAGIVVAFVGVSVMGRLVAEVTSIAFTPRLDARVLAFSFVVTVAAAPLFGLLPALKARRLNLNVSLTSGGRAVTSGGRQRTQFVLVATEIALTVVLVTSAGLLMRSLNRVATADPGFDPHRVLAFDVSLPDVTYTSSAKRLAFTSRLLERLRSLPGVEGAGSGMSIPFSGGGYGEFFRRPVDERSTVTGRLDFVSPGYLEALGAELVGGRWLADADNRADGPRVVVISEATARLFFADGDAVGHPLVIAGNTWQVLGIVADIVDRRMDTARGAFAYAPQAFNTSAISIVIRTPLSPLSLLASARQEVERLDSGVALANPRVLDREMSRSMVQRQVLLGLVGVFAVAALALASIGLYGVMAYAVSTRQREFGIRMAFGAGRRDLIHDVLVRGARMIGVGLVLGLAGAAASSRLLASELFQVGRYDPWVLGITAATVIFVGMTACVVPALRASRLDPLVALRND